MNIFFNKKTINSNLEIAERLFSTSSLNPFLAISIGSRPPELDKAIAVLKWMLKSGSKTIPILITDDIWLINYIAFGYSHGKALKQVKNGKDRHMIFWEDVLRHLKPEESLRFRFVVWKEIITPIFIEQQNLIREVFSEKTELYNAILLLAEEFINNSGKTFTLNRCLGMAEYIIQELPALLFGIEIDNVRYQMITYPTFLPSKMINLIAFMRVKSQFSELLFNLSKGDLEYAKVIQMVLYEEQLVDSDENVFKLEKTPEYSQ